ncbi:hypothetical protein P153DRAFT_361834 [Dothidotthia symphoricarpi CBS 119687]|uniref:Uncharacterized protein n=1 Tax=Dothidotthia symphoricarpi CBS 119687 TaxID=1392245 RepID=A0A6A5ZW05_9PLEO|nr:uncharacterized protein P153DRAFT_361834 [Dothidotthia symphoricarpi CBS 119687]KAF2123709.1 hypothetical protein P153DRAFT_361834 [Dothidotthia symphoricarpi CBS 119687]
MACLTVEGHEAFATLVMLICMAVFPMLLNLRPSMCFTKRVAYTGFTTELRSRPRQLDTTVNAHPPAAFIPSSTLRQPLSVHYQHHTRLHGVYGKFVVQLPPRQLRVVATCSVTTTNTCVDHKVVKKASIHAADNKALDGPAETQMKALMSKRVGYGGWCSEVFTGRLGQVLHHRSIVEIYQYEVSFGTPELLALLSSRILYVGQYSDVPQSPLD